MDTFVWPTETEEVEGEACSTNCFLVRKTKQNVLKALSWISVISYLLVLAPMVYYLQPFKILRKDWLKRSWKHHEVFSFSVVWVKTGTSGSETKHLGEVHLYIRCALKFAITAHFQKFWKKTCHLDACMCPSCSQILIYSVTVWKVLRPLPFEHNLFGLGIFVMCVAKIDKVYQLSSSYASSK